MNGEMKRDSEGVSWSIRIDRHMAFLLPWDGIGIGLDKVAGNRRLYT